MDWNETVTLHNKTLGTSYKKIAPPLTQRTFLYKVRRMVLRTISKQYDDLFVKLEFQISYFEARKRTICSSCFTMILLYSLGIIFLILLAAIFFGRYVIMCRGWINKVVCNMLAVNFKLRGNTGLANLQLANLWIFFLH